ncbi:MAG: class I SAM-dependent methyltransferase [Acidiferrobacteraceae bacterium]
MLDGLLEQYIRNGTLRVEYPEGRVREFGSGAPHAVLHLKDPSVEPRILRDPEYELGATYADGLWETPEPAGLLGLLYQNFCSYIQPALGPFARLGRLLRQWNRGVAARRQIAHHYDLEEWLFRRFLDRDLHYSCAYYTKPELTLEAAQREKCAHLARKLRLRPGAEVLDIGCGWGSLALYLAATHGVHVTGVTLSKEQWRVANDRARARGLGRQVRFLYEDYREHQGRYQRIVSVGMFEHVGIPNYPVFFDQVARLLEPGDGIAVLHHIGRPGPPGTTNPWIRRHVFPGGYNPSLSEVLAPIEHSGLWTTDIEVWRLHYQQTLKEWGRRFQAARPEVVEKKGEHFARLWEFYLAACEAAFAVGQLVVFQLQLANALQAVPLTRDYLYAPPSETEEQDARSPRHRPGGPRAVR